MGAKEAFYEDFVDDEDEETIENVFLTFSVANREYGLKVRNVIEITKLKTITEVPDMFDYVKGIINLRGKIIPLIDVRLRFNNPGIEYHDRTCVIIVNLNGRLIGLIVDGVSEVIRIADDQMEPSPGIAEDGGSRFIQSIGKVGEDVKMILNLDRFLNEKELADLNKVDIDARKSDETSAKESTETVGKESIESSSEASSEIKEPVTDPG